MFDNIMKFFKKFSKEDSNKDSGKAAKERLHLVLMQDRANVSADFMELMKQEIIEVIKKYIDVDENSIDVKLTNKVNSDGTTGAPILYANIPILNVKDDTKQINIERKLDKDDKDEKEEDKKEEQVETVEEKAEAEKEEKDKKKENKKVEEKTTEEVKDQKEKEEVVEEPKQEVIEESKEEDKNSK